MVRFAGNLHARRYAFWLDVPPGAAPLHVRLFVKRVQESDAAAEALLHQLPDWTSPAVRGCLPPGDPALAALCGWRSVVGRAAPAAALLHRTPSRTACLLPSRRRS